MSLSNIPAALASGVDGSVKSVLRWISCIQEEWLIIFDNADNLLPEVVAKFIPPGNRGNILITSRNKSMGRIVSFENIIEVKEMEEADAMTLFLKASCLDALPEHLEAAKRIVTELGCIPLAVYHAGAYIEAGNCDINTCLRHFLHRRTLQSDATFTGASDYNTPVTTPKSTGVYKELVEAVETISTWIKAKDTPSGRDELPGVCRFMFPLYILTNGRFQDSSYCASS